MANLLLVVLSIWIMGAVTLTAHALMHRYGVVLLILIAAGLTALLQFDFGVIFAVAGLEVRVTAATVVPLLLLIVLVMYSADGAAMTRLMIIVVYGVSLVVLAFGLLYGLHLSTPDALVGRGALLNVNVYALNPVTLIASFSAFGLNFLLCTVGYQWWINLLPHVSRLLIASISLLVALTVDSFFFRLIYDLGRPDFADRLAGDLLGKWVGGLALLPLLIGYLAWVAPRLPGYVGLGQRRTFDVFTGSFANVRGRLLQAERDLNELSVARRQEAAYLKQISDIVNEGFWLADPAANQPVYINPAYERIWGYPLENFAADPNFFISTVLEEDRPRMPNYAVIVEKRWVETEFRIRRSDGQIRWIRERAFAIADEQGVVYRVGGVSEDITERHTAEQQQQELLLEREKLRVLRDVIADATHDLKAPLSSINLKMYALQRQRDPDKQAEILTELESITKRMAHLIDDVLTLARLDNTHEADRQPCDLAAVVAELVPTLRPIADARGILLRVDLPSAPLPLVVDRADIERAVGNLIDNALHYTPRGGMVTVQVTTRTTPTGAACVRVQDTGIGIPAAELEQIFDRFFRSDNARALDPGGTGLGLAIVRKVAEQHNGGVDVTSQLGQGTTFTLWLPTGPA